MAIVESRPCPKCLENGHDKTGNHALVFEDGGVYCGKKSYHKDGEVYYKQGNGNYINDIINMPIDGNTKYTITTFKALEAAGKLNKPAVRAIALRCMSKRDRWEVGTQEEREELLAEIPPAKKYFDDLPVRNLVSRGIKGQIAREYDVHVGLDENGKVASHYYPIHSKETREWQGAQCRTLPKDFSKDHLGLTFGEVMLFGQKVSEEAVAAKRARYNKLLIVGGACDMMAAVQMLRSNDPEGKYFYHVWSPVHGEKAMQDIVANKEAIDQFKEIICGLDNDEVGRDTNLKISRLFRGKCKFLQYPSGTKDANQCLMEGRTEEFIAAWFSPIDRYAESKVMTVDDLYEDALKEVPMGLSWFAPLLNKLTLGIRLNMLMVLGAGSGVGKTEITKQLLFHLMENHGQKTGVIYLEEPPIKTLKSYASFYSNNKRLDLPKNDPTMPETYKASQDYTDDEARECIDKLRDLDMLHIVKHDGDKSVEAVMGYMDDMLARGIKYIVLDNLMGIDLPKGAGNKVDALDAVMKRLGDYKDENECFILLIAHLKQVDGDRVPHAYGGMGRQGDFKGTTNIVNWANYTLIAERNCFAEDEHAKRITLIRCLKDRDYGMETGSVVALYKDENTGRMIQYHDQSIKSVQDEGMVQRRQEKKGGGSFNYGSGYSKGEIDDNLPY